MKLTNGNHSENIENIDSNIFKALFENSLSGILYGNPDDGNIYDANFAASKMFGYTIDELRSLNRNDVFNFNHSSMIDSLKTRQENGSAKGELIGIRKNGEVFPCEFASSIFKNKKGENRTCTILNDISERKQSEEEIALFLNNTEESFVYIDKDFKIVYFNKQFSNSYFLNYKKPAIKGSSIFDYASPERKDVVIPIFNKVLKGEVYEDFVEKPVQGAGSLYYHVKHKPAYDFLNNVIGIFISTRDITNQKVIEQEMKLLLDNTKESFVLLDVDMKIVSFNKSFKEEQKFYFDKDVKKGDLILDYVVPEGKNEMLNLLNNVIGGGVIERDLTIINRDHKINIRRQYLKPALNFKGKLIGIFITSRDITEKRKAQNLVIANEKRFRAIVEYTGDMISMLDEKGNILYVNPAVERITGFSKEKLLDHSYKLSIHPDYEKESQETFKKLIDNPGLPISRLIKIKHQNGNYIWVDGYVTNLLHDENVKAIVSNYRDITERVISNQQLEQEQRDKEALINTTEDLLWSVNTNYELLSGNKAFIDTLKKTSGLDLKPRDNLLLSAYYDEDFINYWETLYQRSFLGEKFKVEMYSPDQPNIKKVYLETSFNPIYDGNVVTGVACYSRDITESKIAFEQLSQSEIEVKKSHEQLTKLTDSINTVVYQFEMTSDGKMTFPFVSKSIYKMIPEVDIETLKIDGTLAFKHVHPNDIQGLINSIHESRNNLSYWSYEYRYVGLDGNEKWISGSSHPTQYENGTTVWYGYFQDITEQKYNRENLNRAVERYDIIAKATNDTIWDIDLKSNTIKWSNGIKTIFGYNENDPNISDANWWYTKIHPEDLIYIKNKSEYWIKSKEIRCEFEYRFLCANNEYKYILDRGFLMLNDLDEPIRMIGAMQDITVRKESEKELEKTLSLLNTTSSLAKIGGWEVDLISKEHFWSPEIYHILEVDKSFIPTIHKAITFFAPHSKAVVKNAIQDGINEGLSWNIEVQAYTTSGKLVDLRAQGSAVVKNKRTVKLLGTLQDITQQKIADKKLRESEERYRTMVECSPDSVTVHSNGKILYVNPTAVKMFGAQSLHDLVGKSVLDIIHPDYHEMVIKRIQNTINGIPNNINDDYKLIMLDGTMRDVIVEGTAIVYNGVPAIHTVIKDITQRKKEEELLRLLESVVTHTNDSIMITEAEPFDEPGPTIVYVNEAFTKMTGYSEEELVGKSPRILQGIKTDKEELKRMRECMQRWEPCEVTVINYKKNGEEYWNNFSIKPLADATGWFTHWIAVERDVTQQKNNELEREQIIAELSQNNKDLKQFSYVTSHNLRAPIANLLGLTSLIDQYKIPNKSLKQIIDGVRQSALMFDETVKDLSKVLVIKDQTNIIKEEVSFVGVIDNVLKQLSIAMDDNSVKINYEFSNAPFVLFTSTYLESILLNLFTNAIKYKSLKRKLKIDIVSTEADGFVILKFKDNGIGIDTEKYKDKLFKLYQRFHDNPDGKGLGLYLVKSQLEALGGTIAIESEVDKGATFIIKFKK